MLKLGFSVCAFAALAATANAASLDYLRELDRSTSEHLVTVRLDCAANQIPQIFRKVAKDNPRETLPSVDAYCRRALELSGRHNAVLNLYIDLALREQGYDGLYLPQQAPLLAHDETNQTVIRIFFAAGRGQPSYVGIAGKVHPLSCPLALDAGFAWGYRNPDRGTDPVPLTETSVNAIARACYDASVKTIPFGWFVAPTEQAGLYAGAWLGRRQRHASGH